MCIRDRNISTSVGAVGSAISAAFAIGVLRNASTILGMICVLIVRTIATGCRVGRKRQIGAGILCRSDLGRGADVVSVALPAEKDCSFTSVIFRSPKH